MCPQGASARRTQRSVWLRFLLVAVATGLLWISAEGPSEARRAPYYVLQGTGNADVRPRILFVVDTSGSMGWRATSGMAQCAWNGCEKEGDPEESRISVARRVIQDVVLATQSRASFGLMTFDQNSAPTATPLKCSGQRFSWVTWYGYFAWAQMDKYSGVQGAWNLCQGLTQTPYPYLRWDNLGQGSVITADDQNGTVPSSPLISTAAGQIDHWSNGARSVQWFPKFLGVRVNLNSTTDPTQSILHSTVGDYGSNNAARTANVWGRDFYYWPYVDGFPHYSDTTTWPYVSGANKGGISGENGLIGEAKLYAPFYLDLEDSGVPQSAWGPRDATAALDEVIRKTNPLIAGGLDVAGATPWASVIGEIPGSATSSNAEFSHTSVSSYLRFVTSQDGSDSCAPTSVVMLTDGVPSPGEGGPLLYDRLAAVRDELGVKTYAVGFFTGADTQINDMACAAAGACDGIACASPCDDSPALSWDTCADPQNPTTSCAYLADSADELAAVLIKIVQSTLSVDLDSGPAYTSTDFSTQVSEDGEETRSGLQTTLTAHTEYPGWKGHLMRDYCAHTDEDGDLLPLCVAPSPEFGTDDAEATFGPCPQSRSWDAGVCLQSTTWNDRRIYSALADGTVYAITEANGSASTRFTAELNALGFLPGNDDEVRANAIAAFILGKDWPDGWKLPGLANSAPVLVRRVPVYRAEEIPSVNIRDPHCGGRAMSGDTDVPTSLIEFSQAAWSDDEGVISTPSDHYRYQEAVMIGDDLGILHAFQYNSGNELWGFLPREAFATAVAQSEIGAAARGQPDAIADHHYGVASTLNSGWVYDDRSANASEHRWRHLGVFGFGVGGRDYYALDLTHMSPQSSDGPFEVLWSTSSVNGSFHDRWLGETWARPALTYHVPNDAMGEEPDAFLVMGSGYAVDGTDQGRALMVVDALSGEVRRWAQLEAPSNGETMDTPANYGALVDPAVASHCLSGFWAEAQESYIADPAGRIYRWDVGRTGQYEADSGGTWQNGGLATPAVTLSACRGAAATCSVAANAPGDVFTYAPAVSANNRIDDISGQRTDTNEYLVALVSGAADDATVDARAGSTFHSSLYLLVDNHSSADDFGAGFSIPSGSPKMTLATVGSDPAYLRLAFSDLSRTRKFRPYPTAQLIEETRNFSAATRPIASPQIRVFGVVEESGDQATPVDGNEIYVITYTVYEPPTAACDARFYDASTGTWHTDQGDAFTVSFRLTASTGGGFNFTVGSNDSDVDFGDGFSRGLTYEGSVQLEPPGCTGGNCGSAIGGRAHLACESDNALAVAQEPLAVTLSNRELRGFTPFE